MEEKYLKFINENQLVSVMNKTKWSELADAMTSGIDFEPIVRLKYLLDADAMPGFSLLDWEWVRDGNTRCIEWMDIDPIKREHTGQLIPDKETDFSAFVIEKLKENNIPYSIENCIYRVWGYTYPGKQPNFV